MNQGTFMAEAPVYLALSMRLSPYDMMMYEDSNDFFDYWHCNQLPGIEEGYNYIVRDIYVEYADELRQRGFSEIRYKGYSLFYWEEK